MAVPRELFSRFSFDFLNLKCIFLWKTNSKFQKTNKINWKSGKTNSILKQKRTTSRKNSIRKRPFSAQESAKTQKSARGIFGLQNAHSSSRGRFWKRVRFSKSENPWAGFSLCIFFFLPAVSTLFNFYSSLKRNWKVAFSFSISKLNRIKNRVEEKAEDVSWKTKKSAPALMKTHISHLAYTM